LAVGFLHAATGGWKVPVLALLGVLAFEFWAGWLAARGRTLPAAGPDSPASPGSVHSNL
jgi:cyanate permease